MDWKLELVAVPVTDVDRAKHFYSKQVDFVVDHNTRVSDDMRMSSGRAGQRGPALRRRYPG